MLIKDILKKFSYSLAYHSLSWDIDIEVITAFVMAKDRAWLYANLDFDVNEEKLMKIEKLVADRKKGVPVAYLIGKKNFYSIDFYVDKNVLIPRPETEELVDRVLKDVEALKRNDLNRKIAIVDIGTGSGCIIGSMYLNLSEFRNISYYAVEKSKRAFWVAARNFSKLSIFPKKIKLEKNSDKDKILSNINLYRGDLIKPFLEKDLFNGFKDVFFIANLPYVSFGEYKELDKSVKKEPKEALLAEKNGTALIKKSIKQIIEYHRNISSGHKNVLAYFEISPNQTEELSMFAKRIKDFDYRFHLDLSDHYRFLVLQTRS